MAQQNGNSGEDRDFADMIKEFAHGSTNRAATEALRNVVRACVENGGKGSVTLKLVIDTKAGVAEIKAKLGVSKPEPALPGGHFYYTENGDLVDEDPRQLKLPAKIIDAPAKLKTIEGGNA